MSIEFDEHIEILGNQPKFNEHDKTVKLLQIAHNIKMVV